MQTSRTAVLVLALSLAPLAAGLGAAPPAGGAGGSGGPDPADAVRSTAHAPFPNFESSAVRPLLLAPDGAELYALNTPDHRVEVFRVRTAPSGLGGALLEPDGAVFCGLEPVSMCLHPDDPNVLFVANAVSDSVSVVDLARRTVVATIPVGDKLSDVAVAGGKLFIACARSFPAADLLVPGPAVENAVVVADATPPYRVVDRVAIPAFEPRALVADGRSVHVIPLHSGNHTTTLSELQTQVLNLDPTDADAFDEPFEVNPALEAPGLDTNDFVGQFGQNGWIVPPTGRVVMDSEYPTHVPQLPDHDVLTIDVATHALAPTTVKGVGTTLFALARNPVTGELWVANTDARNRTRFEPRVKGRAVENRVTTVAADGTLGFLPLAPPLTSAEHAQPVALAFHAGPPGDFAYVAALGTATVVVLDAVTGALVTELATGELPIGLAVDPARHRLYVLTRGDDAIRTYAIGAGHVELGVPTPLGYDPEPKIVREGRAHLYDARAETGAGNGNMSCATCHVSGHQDFLAWDLGDPEGGLGYFYPDLMTGPVSFNNAIVANRRVMMTHPMKGPMVTQSLRGLDAEGATPLHWRGDRRFLQLFQGAFRGLLGGEGISDRAMQQFTAFVDSLTWAPNPYQPKDREYRGMAAAGRDLYGMNPDVPGKPYNLAIPGNPLCIDCHRGDFAGRTDFTGSRATVNFDAESQLFNTGQLRGAYEKEFRHLTGYGTLHDGTVDGIEGFLNIALIGGVVFNNFTAAERAQVARFVKQWDTGLAPLVGAQRTSSDEIRPPLGAWLDLAQAQAEVGGELDLVAHGVLGPDAHALPVGLVYAWNADLARWDWLTSTGKRVTRAELDRALASGALVATFTCVPPGTGLRLGVDRDEDGLLDGIEARLGTDPAHPDTDRDGYADGAEAALGGKPTVPDANLPDATAPTITAALVRGVFATAATVHVETDEAARVKVELGLAPGTYDLDVVRDRDRRRVHDLVLTDLPAGTTLFWRVVATDTAGNDGVQEGSFDTAPPLYRVEKIGLTASAGPPYTVTGTVLVLDQDDAPVVDIPVKVIWAGDIGGANFFPTERTDANGVATFVLGPYTPTSATTVTISPAFVGALAANDPYFVGRGGDTPTFFYNQSTNGANYRSIDLP